VSIGRRVLITGATGAIGGALAEVYAAPGVELYLHGRNETKLAAVAERCAALGAKVLTQRFDVRDTSACVPGWMRSAQRGHSICGRQLNRHEYQHRAGGRGRAVE
jgi:NADP-dependent 3-hydroxy acid dehydrogenase YdfG